jgi:hypothetical protein
MAVAGNISAGRQTTHPASRSNVEPAAPDRLIANKSFD